MIAPIDLKTTSRDPDTITNHFYKESLSMNKTYILSALLAGLAQVVDAQNVAINETGNSAHSSALLHVHSTTKGILVPRMTTTQRQAIVNPAIGLIVFDTETTSFWFRSTSNQWRELQDSSTEYFFPGTQGLYTNASGIGVGGTSPLIAGEKFVAIDSSNLTAYTSLRNKHAIGNTAYYLLDEAGVISGALLTDNANKDLFLHTGQPVHGDIVFTTNQAAEGGTGFDEVVRIKRLGGVGIGTSNPGAKLQVNNTASTMTLRAENAVVSNSATYGILNNNNSDGTGRKYGIFSRVYGKPTSNTIYGVYGLAETAGHPMDAYGGYFEADSAGTGTHFGVYTKAQGEGNYALYSENSDSDGWAAYMIGRAFLSGRLGIGIDTPQYRIHVVSNNRRSIHLQTSHASTDTSYGIFNDVEATGLGVRYGMQTRVFVDTMNTSQIYGLFAQVGAQGTGTHWGVLGRANGDGNIGVEGNSNGSGIAVKGVNTDGDGWAGYFEGNAYIMDRLEIRDKIFLRPAGHANGGEIELFDDDGDQTVTIRAGQSTTNGAEMLMYNESTTLTLELDADGNGNAGELKLFDEEGDNTMILRAAQNTTNGAELLMYNDAGELTIELDADFSTGNGRIITDELQITGGSDLAEHFDIAAGALLVPGTLVSVDPSGNGSLITTSVAYDTRVAGVISGANGISPGMLMGQQATIADGAYPVALVGRVYVLADATRNPICPGDLLTSSSKPGHVMTVRNQRKAQGATVGKAITGLAAGTGYVLVLVNLQ